MKLDFNEITRLLAQMAGKLKYFPADVDARLGIADEIAQMAGNIEQVRWLARRVPRLYSEWPGTREVRAVFCSKFKPRDGFEVYSEDPRYVQDGIPSEREEMAALPPADYKQLPPAASELLNEIATEAKDRLTRTAAHDGWLNQRKPDPPPYPTQDEIDRIKAAQQANRMALEITEDKVR